MVDIRTDVATFATRLRYLAQHADQDHAITGHAVFDVTHEGGDYVVREDGDVVFADASGEIAFETLFERIQRRAFAALPDDIRIHAASGIDEGRMFLLVGPPLSGKTTIALHLLLNGTEMVGDELVLLRGGTAAAFPRKFYLRESSFKLLPAVQRAAADLPRVIDSHGAKRLAIDPKTLGRSWRIARAPVKAIFYLDPEFSTKTTTCPCTRVDMVRYLMEQCAPPLSQRKDWIADLCNMVNGATVRMLRVGDLDSAAIAIRDSLRYV